MELHASPRGTPQRSAPVDAQLPSRSRPASPSLVAASPRSTHRVPLDNRRGRPAAVLAVVVVAVVVVVVVVVIHLKIHLHLFDECSLDCVFERFRFLKLRK